MLCRGTGCILLPGDPGCGIDTSWANGLLGGAVGSQEATGGVEQLVRVVRGQSVTPRSSEKLKLGARSCRRALESRPRWC